MQKQPRGIRNNNPGNIDYNKANNWRGQLGIETGVPNPRFARFDTAENGIRAIAKLLLNYYKKGFRTVHSMLNRWAPSFENHTLLYVAEVAGDLGVKPDEILPLTPDQLCALVTSIIEYECGYGDGKAPYDPALIRRAVMSAYP